MTEWAHDSKIVLTKNATYWDKDKVKLDTVNIKVIKEEDSRYQELYTGGLDMCDVTLPEWEEKIKALGTLDFFEKIQPGTVYMLFNQDTTINGVKFFSNVKIRKAFSAAINRTEACDLVYDGTETPAIGWVPPKVLIGENEFRQAAGFDPVTKLLEEVKDPKALLIEGLKELGADPDPSKYTVGYLVGSTSARGKKNAEVYQQMFQNTLGINIKIEQVESAVKTNRVQALQYDLIVSGWLGDYNDPATFLDMFRTTAPVYPSGYKNKEYDSALDNANLSQDSAVRMEAFKKAEKLLVYEDAVLAPIGFDIQSEFQYKYVKNVMRPLFGSIAEFKYAYIQGRK
jgi:oligopeptide transport system substrate-binding protein